MPRRCFCWYMRKACACVRATLEVESGTNDPFAVFLTLMLVELISVGESSAWHVALEFGREAVLGAIIGVIGGRLVVLALNRVALPQGLHAPFVATAALVIFGGAQIAHASGFLDRKSTRLNSSPA